MGSMTTAHAPTRLSNIALGRILGLDHTSISRLRRGERGCSVAVMLRIEETFGWSVREQHAALKDGSFPQKFEFEVSEWTATRPADSTTP